VSGLAAAVGGVVISPEESMSQSFEDGSINWAVENDGAVKALVVLANDAGASSVSGQLTWTAPNGQPQPIAMNATGGALTATAPKLEPGITQVEYALQVNGKPWKGTLQVPEGGTRALVADAALASKDTRPTGKGPRGGVIQIVGDDRVEIVADQTSGQARVYVLGPDDKDLDVGDRDVRLGVVADRSEVITLTPEPGHMYLVGTLSTRAAPIEITVSIASHGATHVCLVGWKPGVVVVIGPRAPHIDVWVHGWGWGHGHDDDDDENGNGHGHDDDDHDRDHGHGGGNGGGGGRAKGKNH
jgi:hypothetical protein